MEDKIVNNVVLCKLLLCSRVGFYFFFFSSRRRHTRCSRDWSSDVCSSDLIFYLQFVAGADAIAQAFGALERHQIAAVDRVAIEDARVELGDDSLDAGGIRSEERRVGKECRARWSPDR